MNTPNPYEPPNPPATEDPPLVAQLAVEGEGMTVEYEQTFEDLVVFSDYHWRQQPKLRQHLIAVFGLFLLGTGGLALLGPEVEWEKMWMSLTVCFLGGAFLLAIWAYRVFASRYLLRRALQKAYAGGKNFNVVGPRRIKITPEFLMHSSPLSQSVYRWAGVEKVRGDREGIYIFVSSLAAFVLPRRAFNSEQHFQEFAATAEKYLRQ